MGCMDEYDFTYDVCPYCGYVHGSGPGSPDQLPPMTVILNRYVLGRAISRSKSKIIYIAWDSKLQTKVVVKEYLPSVFASRAEGEENVVCHSDETRLSFLSGIKRVLEDGKRLARLSDIDGIAQVYDCGEANGTAYVIMELLEGETLSERLDYENSFSFSDTVGIMLPVLQTLSELHKAGLVHADISPDSIFICDSGEVKLIDFGSFGAGALTDEKSRTYMLKAGYAPPERYGHSEILTPATDVYSVCAVIYRMLTGETPPESVVRRLSNSGMIDLMGYGDIPDDAAEAVMRGMAVSAGDRIYGAEELYEIFLPYLKTEESYPDESVSDGGPEEKPAENIGFIKKYKTAIIAACLVLVAVVSLIFILSGVLGKRGDDISDETGEGGNIVSGSCGGSLRWRFDESTKALDISGSGDMIDFSENDERPWDRYTGRIKSVNIGKEVGSIGDHAFEGSSLRSVFIPSDVVSVGKYAFNKCLKLETVQFEDGGRLRTIGDSAFRDCEKLVTLVFGNGISLEKVGAYAFYGCGIKDVTVPPSLREIPIFAFSSCNDLSRVKFSEDGSLLKKIDANAFSNCAIESITLPSGLYSIGSGAFSGNPELVSAFIPATVTEINSGAFYGINDLLISSDSADAYAMKFAEEQGYRHSLKNGSACGETLIYEFDDVTGTLTISGEGEMYDFKEMTLPPWEEYDKSVVNVVVENGVTKIGSSAFEGCTDLTNVTIPEGVTAIGERAFYGCSDLSSFSLPESIFKIGTAAFHGTRWFDERQDGIVYIGNIVYSYKGTVKANESVLRSDIKAIADKAFEGCTVSSIEIPEGVNYIGDRAFFGWKTTQTVYLFNEEAQKRYDEKNPAWSEGSEARIKYISAGDTLIDLFGLDRSFMPNVVGMSYDSAVKALNNAGFHNIKKQEIKKNDPSLDKKVYYQDPPSRILLRYPTDTEVTLSVYTYVE